MPTRCCCSFPAGQPSWALLQSACILAQAARWPARPWPGPALGAPAVRWIERTVVWVVTWWNSRMCQLLPGSLGGSASTDGIIEIPKRHASRLVLVPKVVWCSATQEAFGIPGLRDRFC